LTFKVKINYKALTKLEKKRKVVKNIRDIKESIKILSFLLVALLFKSPALVSGKGVSVKLRLKLLL
jgi:hypothetical protein